MITKLGGQADLFKENARRMRAVLRVPRLTKLYHDLIRGENMHEFSSLDRIYEGHFNKVAEDLGLADDGKGDAAAQLSKEQEMKFDQMSVAE